MHDTTSTTCATAKSQAAEMLGASDLNQTLG